MATIFTRIVQGEIPSYKIAEDEKHFAFLDINPIAEGHTLVIPKKETDYLFDLTDEEMADLSGFAKMVAKGIDKALNTIRTGVIVDGREVPHAHIHLIPISKHGQKINLGQKINVSEERMKEIAQLISNEVRS
ncbi:HIT family protein [Balneola sp. MJW-20]|uniref:HIT family protein n=1 Tax=Gracilimonas aurantiaca TaxID=3234185 RepID=UPI003467D299